MPHRFQKIDWKKTLDSIPKDVADLLQKGFDEQNEKDFISLCTSLKQGKCSLCGHSLDYYDENAPCFHLLLNPKLRRKVRENLFSRPISFIKLYTYLAWVANSEKPFENINDILCDISDKRLFEATIRYKNIQWSFCFSKEDLEGHHGSKIGKMPHYHFQMSVDNNIIVSYNSTHIQFTPDDFMCFEMIRQNAIQIDPQYASGLDMLKGILQVSVLPNGLVEFVETISEEEAHITYVVPETINQEQLLEVGKIFENSNMEVYQIIDELNIEKGYNIKYYVFSRMKDNPIKKAKRI